MARYTLFVDGISKAFAATGLRVGWGVGPVDVIDAHVGRPRPRRRLGAARRAGGDRGACSTTPTAIRALPATVPAASSRRASTACTRASRR